MSYYEKFLDSLHPSIIKEMLDEQERQGNPRDFMVFKKSLGASKPYGGFDWVGSRKKRDYWCKILSEGYVNWKEQRRKKINNVNYILI